MGKSEENRKVASRVREKDVLQSCLRYLRNADYWCWRNNSGVMFKEYRGKQQMIRLGPCGMPDITIIMDDGSMVWVECKRPTAPKLRPEQEAWRTRVTERGHRYIVATCVADLLTNGL